MYSKLRLRHPLTMCLVNDLQATDELNQNKLPILNEHTN